jgi:hypothetical protein
MQLMFVYLPHRPRRGYVYRRRVPKPFVVALHILCLGQIRRMDPEEVDSVAWETLMDEVSKQWCIEFESAKAYFYSERYSSPAVFALFEALLEQGFTLSDILEAIEQHLPCNQDRKYELRPGGCIFNLYLFIRQLPKPRWHRRAARRGRRHHLSGVRKKAAR